MLCQGVYMKISSILSDKYNFSLNNNNNRINHHNKFATIQYPSPVKNTVSFGRVIDYGIPSTIAKELHPKVTAIHENMDFIKSFFAPYNKNKPLLGSKIKKLYPDVVQKRHAGITFHLPDTNDTLVIIKGKQQNLMWINIEDGSKFNGIILDGTDKLVANYSENHPHMLPRILKHMSAEKISEIQPEKFINLAYAKMNAYADFIRKFQNGEITIPKKERVKKIKIAKPKKLKEKKIKPIKVKAEKIKKLKTTKDNIKQVKQVKQPKTTSPKVKKVKVIKIKPVRIKSDKIKQTNTSEKSKLPKDTKNKTEKVSSKPIKQTVTTESKKTDNKTTSKTAPKSDTLTKGFMTTQEHFDNFNNILQTAIKKVSELFRLPINELPSHIIPKTSDRGQIIEFTVNTSENGKLIVRKKSLATLDVNALPYLSFEDAQKNRLSDYTNIDLTTNEILRSSVSGKPLTTKNRRIFDANFNEVEIRKFGLRLKKYLEIIFGNQDSI